MSKSAYSGSPKFEFKAAKYASTTIVSTATSALSHFCTFRGDAKFAWFQYGSASSTIPISFASIAIRPNKVLISYIGYAGITTLHCFPTVLIF